MKEKGGIHLVPSKLHIYKDKLQKILRIGLPAGFQGVVFALSNVLIQSSVNIFGATIVAGNSAAANIEGFVYVSMNAFHQATVSFTSQNMGAGRYERVNRILFCGQICAIVAGACFRQCLCYFWKSITWCIFIQSGSHSGRPCPAESYCCNLCTLWDDGCHGWKSAGNWLFHYADDRVDDRSLRSSYSLVGNHFSNAGVS